MANENVAICPEMAYVQAKVSADTRKLIQRDLERLGVNVGQWTEEAVMEKLARVPGSTVKLAEPIDKLTAEDRKWIKKLIEAHLSAHSEADRLRVKTIHQACNLLMKIISK